jgi:pantoate kinase
LLISNRSTGVPVPIPGNRRGRAAAAFAPHHVTGFFAPSTEARDPRARGSIGAGLVLDVGVRASGTFWPGPRSTIALTSDLRRPLPISQEAARRLLGVRAGRLEIHLTQSLPAGQGFGSSAAGALASALATAELLGRPRAAAVEVAHLSDLFGGGGLGGVAAIQGGGLEIRTRPGLPPHGHVLHIPSDATVLVGQFGPPVLSPDILPSPRLRARLEKAGSNVDRLIERPRLEEFFRLSEAFTDELGLASPRTRAAIRGFRRRGARAFQAMFGQSVVAWSPRTAPRSEILRWLQRQDVPIVELGLARRGAHVERGDPSAARPRPGSPSEPPA